MVKHSEEPNPRVSRKQTKVLKSIKFKAEPDYYQTKETEEPNVQNVYNMQVYQGCRDRHAANNTRFGNYITGSYKGQLIGCCCDCHDKDNWKHTINKYSPFDEPQILGEVRNRIEYSSMNKNQNRISATVKRLATTKVYPLPKQFQIYNVMPVCCACDVKSKQLPCNCEVCQCNPCPDPNIKPYQEDCPCKPETPIILPCDCNVCKCISCKDPNIKKKTLQDPCDCGPCTCEDCKRMMNSVPKISKSETEDLPIIPKPCTCTECICEECVNIRDVKTENTTEAKPEDTEAKAEDTEAEPEDTEAKPEDTEVKPDETEIKTEEMDVKPEENTEPAEQEEKPEEPKPEDSEPAPEDK